MGSHSPCGDPSYGNINGHDQTNNLIPNPFKPKKQEINDV